MQNKEKYFIIDEDGRYVVGYVVDGESTKYIAYHKTESFAVRPFNNKAMAEEYMRHLCAISNKVGDNHIFRCQHIL